MGKWCTFSPLLPQTMGVVGVLRACLFHLSGVMSLTYLNIKNNDLMLWVLY